MESEQALLELCYRVMIVSSIYSACWRKEDNVSWKQDVLPQCDHPSIDMDLLEGTCYSKRSF